jgi:hypothetical protein
LIKTFLVKCFLVILNSHMLHYIILNLKLWHGYMSPKLIWCGRNRHIIIQFFQFFFSFRIMESWIIIFFTTCYEKIRCCGKKINLIFFPILSKKNFDIISILHLLQDTLMHTFIKVWTQHFMEAHQGLNHQTSKFY